MVQYVVVPGGHFICCLYFGGLWVRFAIVNSPRMARICSVGIVGVPCAEALPTLQRPEVPPRSVTGLRCHVCVYMDYNKQEELPQAIKRFTVYINSL